MFFFELQRNCNEITKQSTSLGNVRIKVVPSPPTEKGLFEEGVESNDSGFGKKVDQFQTVLNINVFKNIYVVLFVIN